MERRFEGETVLVTGAGSGIGRATALRFAREGASPVALLDRSPELLDEVAKEIRELGSDAAAIEVDVSTRESCVDGLHRALDAVGPPRVTVSNVGASVTEPWLDIRPEAWDFVMNVNLTASVIVGQEVSRAMVAANVPGAILYTASIAGYGGVPGIASYSVSKAAIRALVTNMALELGRHRIRVVSVSPGWVDTPGSEEIQGPEVTRQYREEGFPYSVLGRTAKPDDIASLYAFLASDEASYITGTNITIDGGMTTAAFQMPAEGGDLRGGKIE
jgi:NAD(P)-dependent dehydrogenase (short-subunit alcohol dehydrogenase family)